MGDLQLTIRVSDWDTAGTGEDGVVIGGKLRGQMTVQTVKAVDVKGFEVILRWFTDGPGNRDEGVVARQSYPGEKLEPGRELTLAFEFQTPIDGPITYAGKYVKVNWELKGTADIPWAIDPKTTLPVPVVARLE